MKAIETVYKGYHFRSRLEARWAVFFDALGIEYLYEHQGYECDIGEKTYRYLPDFFLPEQSIFVEVKGPEDGFKKMFSDGFGRFLDNGCPLPMFDDSQKSISSTGNGGLLCLGDIPDATYGNPFHPLIRHDAGLHMSPAFFVSKEITVLNYSIGVLLGLEEMYASWTEDDAPHIPINWDTVRTRNCYTSVREAYLKARQARFEHEAVS